MRPSPAEIAIELLDALGDVASLQLADHDEFECFETLYPEIRLVEVGESGPAVRNDDCAVDAFYVSSDHGGPSIVFRADVDGRRRRFTLMHELGHHLLDTSAAELHDAIDQCAGRSGDCQAIEEAVCQAFAGRLLVPDARIEEVLQGAPLKPRHVAELYELSGASWMAVSVRLAEASRQRCAVVLMTQKDRIRFAATSPSAFGSWGTWRPGSEVNPRGPLSASFMRNARAEPETYRWGLGYASAGFCDTLRVDDRLTVAVIADKPSDGSFGILEAPEPAYKDREHWCEHCAELRSVGWCGDCRSRRCPECDRCGCAAPPATNLACAVCGTQQPRRKGAAMCFSCEADFG